jgi:hypothetical protein
MIIDLILQVFLAFLQFILAIILNQPNAVLPSGLQNAIINTQGYLGSVRAFFPIDTLLEILAILLGIEIAIFTYKAIMWLIKKIPTIG